MELQSAGTRAKGRAGSAALFRTSDGRNAHSILRYRASLSRTVGDGLAGPFTHLSHAPIVNAWLPNEGELRLFVTVQWYTNGHPHPHRHSIL